VWDLRDLHSGGALYCVMRVYECRRIQDIGKKWNAAARENCM
jgi:hypothetical protein